MNRVHSVVFLIASKHCISDSLLTMRATAFLLCSLLPSRLTTSNLPWFVGPTFKVPIQYCSLQHQTSRPSPVIVTTGCCFALAPSLHSFWSYFSSSILGPYQPGEFIFQCPIFLLFHIVHGVLKARILKQFAILFSSGPHFVTPLHHDPSILNGPTWHGS